MEIIKEAHQEAHECNSSKEIHDWIDWFEEKLKKKVQEINYLKPDEFALNQTIDEDSFMEGYECAKMDAKDVMHNLTKKSIKED